MPKIQILMPCYNVAETVEETLRGIVIQAALTITGAAAATTAPREKNRLLYQCD